MLDCGVGMSAALVAQFLACAGATVIRVAPRGGDPFDAVYPAQAIWRRDATFEPSFPTPARLRELSRQADVCIVGGEDFPGLERVIDAAMVAEENPRCVTLQLSGYPEATGHDGHASSELLVQARSGFVFEFYRDRPLYMGFNPATYAAALHGLSGVLAALFERERSGLGQVVTTSLYEGVLSYGAYFWLQLERPTYAATFVIPKDPQPLVLRCADGKWIHIVLGAAGSKFNLYRVLASIPPASIPPTAVCRNPAWPTMCTSATGS